MKRIFNAIYGWIFIIIMIAIFVYILLISPSLEERKIEEKEQARIEAYEILHAENIAFAKKYNAKHIPVPMYTYTDLPEYIYEYKYTSEIQENFFNINLYDEFYEFDDIFIHQGIYYGIVDNILLKIPNEMYPRIVDTIKNKDTKESCIIFKLVDSSLRQRIESYLEDIDYDEKLDEVNDYDINTSVALSGDLFIGELIDVHFTFNTTVK